MPQAPTHYPVSVERHRAGSSESAGGHPAGARPARSTGTHPCGRLMEAHDDHEVGFVLIHGPELGAWLWGRLVPLLRRPALAVDLPGRGSRPADRRSLSLETRSTR